MSMRHVIRSPSGSDTLVAPSGPSAQKRAGASQINALPVAVVRLHEKLVFLPNIATVVNAEMMYKFLSSCGIKPR